MHLRRQFGLAFVAALVFGLSFAAPFTGLGAGIWTNPGFSGTNGGHQIRNNIVQNNIAGIELDSTCVNPTSVKFNLIRNNNILGAGSGNGIEANFVLCNATVESKKFSGHANSSILMVAPSSSLGISSNELAGGTPEPWWQDGTIRPGPDVSSRDRRDDAKPFASRLASLATHVRRSYSPLDQINRQNVGQLQLAWRGRCSPATSRPPRWSTAA
jgi:hypothetical protein